MSHTCPSPQQPSHLSLTSLFTGKVSLGKLIKAIYFSYTIMVCGYQYILIHLSRKHTLIDRDVTSLSEQEYFGSGGVTGEMPNCDNPKSYWNSAKHIWKLP